MATRLVSTVYRGKNLEKLNSSSVMDVLIRLPKTKRTIYLYIWIV